MLCGAVLRHGTFLLHCSCARAVLNPLAHWCEMASGPKAVELSAHSGGVTSTALDGVAVGSAAGVANAKARDGQASPNAAVTEVRPQYGAEDMDVEGELGALPMATATPEVKAAALKRVFVAMFLHVFAWAITIPALSPLLTNLTGSSTEAARMLSLLNFAWSGVELCGTLVLGGLSDRCAGGTHGVVGRRGVHWERVHATGTGGTRSCSSVYSWPVWAGCCSACCIPYRCCSLRPCSGA